MATYRTFSWVVLVAALGLTRAVASEHVNVQFTVVGWGTTIPELLYRTDGKDVKFAVPLFQRSRLKRYSGDAVLEFQEKQPSQDGKGSRNVTVASLALRKDQKKVLILLAKDATPGRYRAMALPDDSQAVPAGTARIFNFSQTQLAVRINRKTTISLAPKEQTSAGPENGVLLLDVARRDDLGWKPVLNNYFPINTEEGVTVFLLDGGGRYFTDEIGRSGPLQMVVMRPAPDLDNDIQDSQLTNAEPAEPSLANSGILPP
jgi:hypothetical protein